MKGPVKYAGGVWEELTLMGHWIRDAVVLRWADKTGVFPQGCSCGGKIPDRPAHALVEPRWIRAAMRGAARWAP